MAKISMKQRELKRTRLISKHKKLRTKLRDLVKSQDTPDEEREQAVIKLQSLPVNSCAARSQRRCQVCGRPHAVYRRFKLCRICLRLAVMNGMVPGVVKSSW